MEKQDTLTIGFGAMCDPISKQIKQQKLLFDKTKVKRFEQLADYLIHLRFADILNDSAYEKARQRLFNKIKQHVIQSNKSKAVKPKNNK